MSRLTSLFTAILLACAPIRAQTPVQEDPPAVSQAPEAPQMAHIIFEGQVNDSSADEFVLALAAASGSATIVIELNSRGGSVSAGFKMAKAIERFPGLVACVADGEVSSMAFYVFQSCPLRLMTERSRLFAHDPRFMTLDGINDIPILQQRLEDLNTLSEAMAAHECKRLTIPLKECRRLLASDRWWLTAQSAKSIGAVDNIVNDVNMVLRVLANVFQPQPEEPASPFQVPPTP